MRFRNFICYVLISCAAGALLAGCTLRQAQDDISGPGGRGQGDILPIDAAHRATSSYQQLYRFFPRRVGIHPAAGLLDVNGTLYGTTLDGGLKDKGTVYSISTTGVHTVLYRFRGGSDGSSPGSRLLNVHGTLYGTTQFGGSGCTSSGGCGTVFSVSLSGSEQVLYAFKGGRDGAQPDAGLIDVNGTLYGTTALGGLGCGRHNSGCGTAFSITTTGQKTVLHAFAGDHDGAYPLSELLDVKGVLYGTTPRGGSPHKGTVFSITRAGVEKVIYSFRRGSDGQRPLSGLINVKGMLYGTTSSGGQNGPGCHAYDGGCGTVFRVSTTGAEKVLYRFAGGPDGEQPQSTLIEVHGVLYGTTAWGGVGSACFVASEGCGTVYSTTTAGFERVLYTFGGHGNGGVPVAPLTDVDGTLYGTTYYGGDHDVCCHFYGYGTVFALTP